MHRIVSNYYDVLIHYLVVILLENYLAKIEIQSTIHWAHIS